MDGEARRQAIMKVLNTTREPISGTKLAGQLHVSRQVIVQDIALLRATNKNILATNKGYLIYQGISNSLEYKRSLAVQHKNDRMKEELYLIVETGGRVLDVVVEHVVYGQITVDLLIETRGDVDAFIEKLQTYKTKPLMELTQGAHYHTIEADSIDALNKIEKKLKENGFLI